MAGLSGATELAYARRFRFVIALILLFLLWWFVLGAIDEEAQAVEATSANLVLSQLRSSLVVKGAEAMLVPGEELADYEGANPFDWVDHQWGSYQGDCDGLKPTAGHWCFWLSVQKDTQNHPKGWLIYRSHRPITVDRVQLTENQLGIWRVATEFVDKNRNGVRDDGERSTGLKLESLPQTFWPVAKQAAQE